MDQDLKYMQMTYELANKAIEIDEVPVGALIVYNGEIIATAYNQREINQQATSHAEILCIQEACKKLHSWRLDECELYVTLEPCMMCTGAIIQSRIKRVVYGASEKRWLACKEILNMNPNYFNHHPEVVSGIMEEECSEQISQYFKNKRKKKTIENYEMNPVIWTPK